SRTGRVVVGDDGVEHPPAGGAGGLKSGPRKVCPSSTHGVDRLNDHPNLDFGAQHARYRSSGRSYKISASPKFGWRILSSIRQVLRRPW
ncbi:MAG: hypothetical protein ACREYE_15320, partial [Gammaproteobacteria bacterium]